MSRVKWDQSGEKTWGTGVNQCVLYPYDTTQGEYTNGVAWNGITALNETPSGAEKSDFYADNIKYAVLRSAEDFGATIEAYTYPREFAILDGTAELVSGVTIGQQNRGVFGLSFVTLKGNDTEGQNYGYEIHIVYGATASPSEKSHSTVNDSPELGSFSWEIATTPVNVTGYKPTANVVIDSTAFTSTAAKAKLKAFEDILYGTDAVVGHAATYEETEDTSFDPSKTYYELSGGSYSETSDSSMNSSKTYYEMTSPAVISSEATVARLPLPDEIKTLLSV